MKSIEKHIGFLGFRAKDKVTGFIGVIDSVCFDLYGCIQVSLKPPMNEKGEIPTGYWVDINRVKILSKKQIVTPPNFEEGYQAEGKQGAADKPERIL